MELIAFTPAQQQALEKTRLLVEHSEALRALLQRDIENLADPNGSTRILADADELGEAAGLYPALVLLGRVDWLKAEYERRGIPETVLRDTLSDLPLWIDNCYRATGRMALLEYGWMTNHLRLKLVRLGRLEFIYAKSHVEMDGIALGDPILEIHIPEGPPMIPAEIESSLAAAPDFFRRYMGAQDIRGFTCCSWLLSSALPEILPGSNLALFQQRFRVKPHKESDHQTFERVFGGPLTTWDEMPAQTRLQRAIRDYYLAGGRVCQMEGIILLET